MPFSWGLSALKSLFQDATFRRIFLFGALVHVIAAFFSAGYLHPDEHFQILEFLNLKLGGIQPEQLPWEYHEQMRPWIQPFFYLGCTKLLALFGIDDPFTLSRLFRMGSAALSMLAIAALGVWSREVLSKASHQKISFMLLNLLWFLPFIHVRLSSESVGASIFSLGFVLWTLPWLRQQKVNEQIQVQLSTFFSAGFLLGLAFDIRFHIGIMVASLLAWGLLVYRKIPWHVWLATGLGLLSAVIIGVFIDRWGYGSWAFPPWNYLHQNLFAHKASGFGVAPWWAYLRDVLTKPFLPFGIIILASMLGLWVKAPGHALTWVTLPFFIAHSMIGHKEWRFLFPLVNFIPLMLFCLLEKANHWEHCLQQHLQKNYGKIVVKILILLNFILLLPAILRPAHKAYDFYEFIYYSPLSFDQLHYIGPEAPFWGGHLHPNFIRKQAFQEVPMELEQLDEVLSREQKPVYVFAPRGHDYQFLSGRSGCELLYLTYPRWVLELNVGNWLKKSRVWSLFRCAGK